MIVTMTSEESNIEIIGQSQADRFLANNETALLNKELFPVLNDFFFFFFLRQSFVLVAKAGVQWHNLRSLQPLSPGFK